MLMKWNLGDSRAPNHQIGEERVNTLLTKRRLI